jgi:L-arabinokinase
MHSTLHNSAQHLPDTAAFLETLSNLRQSPLPEARRLFDPESEIIISRAPGRLDVMGGIADYSGSLVLELPIREATYVALQRDHSRRLTIITLTEDSTRVPVVEMSLDDFDDAGSPVEYNVACDHFQSTPARHWAAYAAGAFLVLMRERGVKFNDGARILINSRVPEGKGVSSSAALEVAVMQAVAAAYGITINARDMAILCQKVENLVAGAPCGVMDQMTAACGEEGRLLALLCQPAELCGMVQVPGNAAFWGLDSGVRHAVTGSDYASVRVGAFMGQRIIAEIAGLRIQEAEPGGAVLIDDQRWNGYLANLTPSEFEQDYAAQLPERISGAEFLSRYRGTTDRVTRIEPDRNYAVRVSTAHPIYEHHRVRLFKELLSSASGESRLMLLGEMMYQSHASYSACGLGSAGTDLLVRLVRDVGTERGLYGARITGGGSGGTVAVLGLSDAGDAITWVADKYEEATGYRPYIFSGSSPGSYAFGHLKYISN